MQYASAGPFRALATLRLKVPFAVAFMTVGMLCAFSLLSYNATKSILLDGIVSQFSGTLDAKSRSIETWFTSHEAHLVQNAQNPTVKNAFYRLETAWSQTGSDARETLRAAYLDNNPHPAPERAELVKAEGKEPYHRMHRQFHPYMRSLAQGGELSDILIVTLTGDVIYSVNKNNDYSINLLSDDYADTELGRVFSQAVETEPQTPIYRDFAVHSGASGHRRAVFGASVLNKSGKPAGVLLHLVAPESIQAIINNQKGLIDGGRTEFSPVNQNLNTDQTAISDRTVTTQQLQHVDFSIARDRAANGIKTIAKTATDEAGNTYLYSIQPFSKLGHSWALTVMAPLDTALMPINDLRHALLIFIAICGALSVLFGALGSGYVTRPIRELENHVSTMRENKLSETVPGLERKDEIGRLARDLSILQSKLQDAENERRTNLKKSEDQAWVVGELTEAISKIQDGDLVSTLDTPFPERYEIIRTSLNAALDRMNTVVISIAKSSTEFDEMSQQVASVIENVNAHAAHQAERITISSQALTDLASTIASTAEETQKTDETMQQSIAAVTENSQLISRARDKMEELGSSANEVMRVVEMIETISFQTNLLALNAGVEAARAGSAGKGFAVVASEVRALANRAGDAAKQIADLLGNNVQIINESGQYVDQVSAFFSDFTKELSSASQSMKDVTSSTQDQSRSIETIDEAFTGIGKSMISHGSMLEELSESGLSMSAEASVLSRLASTFVTNGNSPTREDDDLFQEPRTGTLG